MKVGQVSRVVLFQSHLKTKFKSFLCCSLFEFLEEVCFGASDIEIGNVFPQNLLEQNCLQYLISPFLSQCMCCWPLNGPFFSELTQPERNFHFNALFFPSTHTTVAMVVVQDLL